MDKNSQLGNIDAIIYGAGGQDGRILSLIYDHKYRDKKVLLVSKKLIQLRQNSINKLIIFKEIHAEIFEFITQSLPIMMPKIIFFFAAYHQSSFEKMSEEESSRYINYTNVELPVELLKACITQGVSVKFAYASSALIFSNSQVSPQDEHTVAKPSCEYGNSKLLASEKLCHLANISTSECYIFILYGHESIYRQEKFFTKKLLKHLYECTKTKDYDSLIFFNPDQLIDIGYAPEYMICLENIASSCSGGKYIIGSSELISIRNFTEYCCVFFSLDHEKCLKFNEMSKRSNTLLHSNVAKMQHLIKIRPKLTAQQLAIRLSKDEKVWNDYSRRVDPIHSYIVRAMCDQY